MPKVKPMVLLHGSCSNSAAWLGDLPAFASQYHVYAIDIPGEPGNSADYRLDTQSGAYCHWLASVLDALGVKQAILIGNSMGGWLALQFATAYPQRITALALLAPSGIVPPNPAFLAQTADIATNAEHAEAANAAVAGTEQLPDAVLQFMALVMEHFIPITGALPILSDRELRNLTMPVLIITASGDVTMDASSAVRRLLQHVPPRTKHSAGRRAYYHQRFCRHPPISCKGAFVMQTLQYNGQPIAILLDNEPIHTPQDALDMMATADYTYHCHALILPAHNLPDAFFDLKTRLAGEILQKFSNYNMRLGIVGDFSQVQSKALRDFIRECNRGNLVCWTATVDEALAALTKY